MELILLCLYKEAHYWETQTRPDVCKNRPFLHIFSFVLILQCSWCLVLLPTALKPSSWCTVLSSLFFFLQCHVSYNDWLGNVKSWSGMSVQLLMLASKVPKLALLFTIFICTVEDMCTQPNLHVTTLDYTTPRLYDVFHPSPKIYSELIYLHTITTTIVIWIVFNA